jgi:predicted heme/steroid binding protein/uncharacterized membrane protein
MERIRSGDLAGFDGKGRPAYVGHAGKVYDVSGSKLWPGGQHARRHGAGRDLTAEMSAAPHGPEVLDRCPLVGVIEAVPPPPDVAPSFLEALVERHPFLRRHPHPMLVHFPIALFMAAAGFLLLWLVTGNASFETTALHCLALGLIVTPPAMLSGFLTWYLNYEARSMRVVTLKIVLSVVLFFLSLAAFAMRVTAAVGGGLFYICAVLLLTPLVVALGWLGGSLTFPIAKNPDS